ncbi:MAG: type IX secretion system membrane protein PorP/SprF [Bacteroidota bacterium]
MRKNSTLLFLSFLFLANLCFGQQDAMFTKYMFNSLAYNPAFAGTPGYMQTRLLYRNQWTGFEGAPTTQTLTVHTPIMEKVGLGFSLINDKIGATGSTTANFAYSYRIPFGPGNLSIGLQGGVMNWRANWNDDGLRFRDPKGTDEAFAETNPSRWIPNFGAGAFYYAPKWYAGFSVPHMITWDLRKDSKEFPIETDKWAKVYNHYFLTAGGIIPLNGPALVFKPSILIKSVGLFGAFSSGSGNSVGAPTEFDIDASFLIQETLWVGISFRSAFEAAFLGGESSVDSGDIWMTVYLGNGMRVGAAYDYTLTDINRFTNGSFEIMLGYDMNFEVKRVNTPRYF